MVAKVGLLLRAVASCEPNGGKTSELARTADVNRSTAHRLLAELREQGLVEREEATGRWVLGPELFLLGVSAGPRYDVTTLALPVVRRLSVATGESSFFSVRRGNETVCLVQEEGAYPIRSHVLHEGRRFPLGVASAGLAILSFMPEPEQRAYLDEVDLTAYGADHARTELVRRLEETRALGYAVNPGLVVEGSWGMAAAVFDQFERPLGAVSLTGVEHRFPVARQPDLGRLLLAAAHELSAKVREGGAAGPSARG